MKAINVRVPYKDGIRIGKVIKYNDGEKSKCSPFYIVDIGENRTIKVPAHKVEADNHNEISNQFKLIFNEVQQRLQQRCFPGEEK